MSRTIGIDLGTTNSAGAVMKEGKIRLVPPSEGETRYGKVFPSTVAFKEDGEPIVGKNAEPHTYLHPDRTVRWIKRRMGTKYTVEIDGRKYTPQQISAMILKKIKRDAELYVGEKIEKAVISAPAYFNNNQRIATKEAGEIAGLEVLRIISEPTAASLAYGLDQTTGKQKTAVLDLGAGTFDVTILQMNNGIFKVLSTSGDTHLGGKDMDDVILDFLVEKIGQKYHVDLTGDQQNLNRLRNAGERAKIRLSNHHTTTINLPLDMNDSTFEPHIVLTRDELEALIKTQLNRLQSPMEKALTDSGLGTQDIHHLILVGGPTRMPMVKDYITDFFGMEPEKGIDPIGIVATGAAIHGSALKGEIRDMLLLDVTPLSLGVETSGGVFTRLIKRNTTIPAEESMTFATQEDGQTSMMIHILQGEREMAKDNISLGLFRLDGIPPSPRYHQEVEVKFKIDANGILDVSAEILETGEKKEIKVTKPTKLSEEEITRMVIDATKFDQNDQMKKEVIHARNRARAVVYATQKTMENIDRKICETEKKRLEQTLKKVEATLNTNETQKIRNHTDQLLELAKGLNLKAKKIEQARTLISSVEKKLGNRLSSKKRTEVRDVVKRLKKTPYKDLGTEMNKLKEIITLLEADQTER